MQQVIVALELHHPGMLLPAISPKPETLEDMKFSDCLPAALTVHALRMRNRDPMAVEHTLRTPVHLVSI